VLVSMSDGCLCCVVESRVLFFLCFSFLFVLFIRYNNNNKKTPLSTSCQYIVSCSIIHSCTTEGDEGKIMCCFLCYSVYLPQHQSTKLFRFTVHYAIASCNANQRLFLSHFERQSFCSCLLMLCLGFLSAFAVARCGLAGRSQRLTTGHFISATCAVLSLTGPD
jgi:hypothetical protein